MAETIFSDVIDEMAKTSRFDKPGDKAGGILGKLTGRWEITATTPPEQPPSIPWQVTLRVDGDMVSGDVFEPLEKRLLPRQMRLGGRDDWRFSFWGRVSEEIVDGRGSWLTATCDATHRLMPKSAAEPRAILSLRVAPADEGEPRPEIRLTLLHDLGGGGAVGAISERAGIATAPCAPLKRRIHLKYMVALQKPDPAREDLLHGLFGTSGEWTLPHAMDREGIELTVERSSAAAVDMSKQQGASPEDLLEDILVEIADSAAKSRGSMSGASAPPDWTLALVLAGHPATRGPNKGRQILGRAYGLLGGQNRFRTRFGAIVHIGEVEKEIPDLGTGLSTDDALRRLVLHWVMHEMGHLLNLPHCWERDRGFRTLGAAAPASDSYMNYASSWPFGPAASSHYAALGDPKNVKPRSTQRQRYYAHVGLGKPSRTLGFDEAERHFIRHAPLDQIAQGGRTFLDATLPDPAFLAPAEEKAKERVEIGCLSGGAFRRVDRIDLWHWRSKDGGTICFPPVPALVRFIGPDVSADFRFKRGAMQLLARAVPREPRAHDPAPRTVAFDPSRSLKLIQPRVERPNEANLPWMTIDDVMACFLDNPAVFDLQVVYFRDAVKTYASNIVRVSFKEPRPHPASSREFRRLADELDLEALRADFGGDVPKAWTMAGAAGSSAPIEINVDNPFNGV